MLGLGLDLWRPAFLGASRVLPSYSLDFTNTSIKYAIEADTITGVANGANIATGDLVDKSSFARGGLLTASGARYIAADTVTGRPCLEFDGVAAPITTPAFTMVQPLRIYMVAKRTHYDASITPIFIDGVTNNPRTLLYHSSNSDMSIKAGTAVRCNVPLEADDMPVSAFGGAGSYWELYDALYNGASSTSQPYGFSLQTASTTPGTAGITGGVTIGGPFTPTANFYLQGRFEALIIVKEDEVTAQQKLDIAAYLIGKYSIQKRGVMITNGDSQTFHPGTNGAANDSVLSRLRSMMPGGPNRWRGIPFGGNLKDTPTCTSLVSTAEARWDNFYTNTLILFYEGPSDLLNNTTAGHRITGAQAYANLLLYAAAVRVNGKKLVVTTACQNAFLDATDNASLLDFNTLIRNNPTQFDGIVDLAAVLTNNFDMTYFASDGVHVNSAGADVYASLARPVLTGLLV